MLALQGERASAELQRLNASDPGSVGPGGAGARALYPLLWLLRGDACAMRALQRGDVSGRGDAVSEPGVGQGGAAG